MVDVAGRSLVAAEAGLHPGIDIMVVARLWP